jgi:hypothetical protein
MGNNNKEVKPIAKRRPPAAGMGRVKGSLNKTTKTAKEAIALAADKLGGADRLVSWAQEDPQNERVFWGTIYPKLLPLQVTGEGGGAVEVRATLDVDKLPTEVLAQIMKAKDASDFG